MYPSCLLSFLYFILRYFFSNKDYIITSNDRVISEWWIGNDLKESGRGVISRYYPGSRLAEMRKTTKNLNQNKKFRVFLDVEPCIHVEVDQRFRGAPLKRWYVHSWMKFLEYSSWLIIFFGFPTFYRQMSSHCMSPTSFRFITVLTSW
jgi:hypothetical protein